MKLYKSYAPDNYSFSFEEAAVILKPLLDNEDFFAFMIRKEFLNELAQPREEWIKNRVFSFATIVEGESDYDVNNRIYFISLMGLRDIIELALKENREKKHSSLYENPWDRPRFAFDF